MAMKTYTLTNSNEISTDVLLQARQACYKARDAFYACLEKNSGNKPTEIASVGLLYPTECKPLRAEYVKNCRNSWVKHFDRQYCKNKKVQRLLDDGAETRRGPLSLPQAYTFKPPST
ncbi:COX6B domain-containing protein [Cephalotus follicularis]|uniref:COX6B domain-containing protein n=1 Tax=Cephalotus follicularis TaxID=3775 RepID=A0A1Q3CSG9_CEPFO|nr:COX6B domain-containing protein [Cephalotus follicularis]